MQSNRRVRQSTPRKKLVTAVNRREGGYNRTDEPSVTFDERGGAKQTLMSVTKQKPAWTRGTCSKKEKRLERDLRVEALNIDSR